MTAETTDPPANQRQADPVVTQQRSRNAPASTTRRRAFLLYFCGAFGGILSGYDMGVVAGAQLYIDRELHLSSWTQGAFVSALMIGAVVGCLTAGTLTDRVGRRPVLLGAAIIFSVGALGMALAPNAIVLIAFRVVAGVGVGTASVVVPTYLSELAPTRIRGRIASLNQLMIAVGIFVSYLVDYALAPAAAWRWMVGLALVPTVLLFLGMWFQPETPRWLATHNRLAAARRVLEMLRERDEIEPELANIKRAGARTGLGPRALWATPGVRRALLIGLALAVFQQVIGINTIVYYAPTILKSAGFGDSTALLNSVGLGALSIIMTVVASRVVDRVGRKPLLLIGLCAMALSMVVLGGVFSLHLLHHILGQVMAVACLALFKAAFSLSWGPLVL